MSKLQRNSPMPLKVPKKRGNGDEGTEALKRSSTIVGQPELTERKHAEKHSQFNERENGSHAYTE